MIKSRNVIFAEPGKVELRIEDFDDSNIPSGHVLLKNHYSLISTGTELACLDGLEDWFAMPGVPGYVCVGEIVKMADDVTGYQVGDIIYNYGGHQEYNIMPVTGCFCKVPDVIEEKYIPLIRMATIALTAVRASGIEFGDYVAVTGQGTIGIMAAQLAHLQGAVSIGIDRHDSRLKTASECNVDYTINPKSSDALVQIREITKGRMLNTLIEAIGNTEVIMNSMEYMAKNGEMIFLGTPRTSYVHNCADAFFKVFHSDYNLRFKGAHEWKDPYEPDNFVKHSIISNTQAVIDYMASGRLSYKPLLTHTVRPEDCIEVYQSLRTDKDTYLGVVFDWTK